MFVLHCWFVFFVLLFVFFVFSLICIVCLYILTILFDRKKKFTPLVPDVTLRTQKPNNSIYFQGTLWPDSINESWCAVDAIAQGSAEIAYV